MSDNILITARSANNFIGIKNKLPWKIKSELQHFRDTTKEHVVVMGYNTWESLGRKPLINRINIVVTNRKILNEAHHNTYYMNINQIKNFLKTNKYQKVFIIGGEMLYNSLISYCNHLIISEINTIIYGDAKFEFDKSDWELVDSKEMSETSWQYRIDYYQREVDLFSLDTQLDDSERYQEVPKLYIPSIGEY